VSTTLVEARDKLLIDIYDGGTTCPCCGQLAKVYRRPLDSSMAWALVTAYRRAGIEEFHKPTVLPEAADGSFAKLRYWGLIHEAERNTDGSHSGWWQITQDGEDFVHYSITVPKYALIYNGGLLELDDTDGRVSIVDALGHRFDYAELMNRAA